MRAKWTLAAGLCLSIGLAGSSTTLAAGQTVQSAKRDGQGVVQLTYWNMWTGMWEKLVESLVADFNKTHPGIHVKVLSVPSDAETKLLTSIAAGDPPDVFTEWNPYVGAFAQQHALLPLNQFMTGPYAGMKKWFYPVATSWATYKGQLYGLPWMMNSFMMYYNKTMMKAAGLNPNDPPQTLAQFNADQSRMWKISSKGTVEQIGYYPTSFDFWTPTFNVSLMKDGKYDLTNPSVLRLMEWIASFKKYPYAQVAAYIKNMSTNTTDPFVAGKEAFTISGMWEMGEIQAENPGLQFGVVPLPAPPYGNKSVTWINGGYNEIPAGCKHPQQAWEFIAWLSGYHNENFWASHYPLGGWIPPSPAITAKPAYQHWLNQLPIRKEFVNVMLNPHDGTTPVTPVEELYENDLSNAVEYVLQGKETPLQSLTQLQTEMNQAMQQNH